MGRLSVNLCGIELDNPVIPASGTFGFGYEFAEIYDINCLGTFSFKGTTKDSRFGNPTPRIAECTAGMINAVGLQNPGVEKVINEELPKLKNCFLKPVMANVSGFSIDDYSYTCERLDGEEQIGWFEVNVSCHRCRNNHQWCTGIPPLSPIPGKASCLGIGESGGMPSGSPMSTRWRPLWWPMQTWCSTTGQRLHRDSSSPL